MQPVEYSQFLKRWVEKFDPEQAWLSSAGKLHQTRLKFRTLGNSSSRSTRMILIVKLDY